MSYIESLIETVEKYDKIDDEPSYWNLATDSRIGELFQATDLSRALNRYQNKWQKPEACLQFLEKCSKWTERVIQAKNQYDHESNNLKNIFQFKCLVNIYRGLLKRKRFSQRQLFKQCMELSFLFSFPTTGHSNRQTPSFSASYFSRHSMKQAWQSLQSFLTAYHSNLRESESKEFWAGYFPKEYFISFGNSKDITFPVVFVDSGNGEDDQSNGSLEECRLWLDIQLGEDKSDLKTTNLIAFNPAMEAAVYEDRII